MMASPSRFLMAHAAATQGLGSGWKCGAPRPKLCCTCITV